MRMDSRVFGSLETSWCSQTCCYLHRCPLPSSEPPISLRLLLLISKHSFTHFLLIIRFAALIFSNVGIPHGGRCFSTLSTPLVVRMCVCVHFSPEIRKTSNVQMINGRVELLFCRNAI